MSIPSHLPQPRLCTLKKWPTYAGYGFNLHAEKGKPGQYVGKVDPNSPAETGGLGPKYFLVEVNGANVEDLSHQKVVEWIKETPNQVTMLVAPNETYKYCKEHSIVINSDMLGILTFTTPDTEPTVSETVQNEESSGVEYAAPPSPSPSAENRTPVRSHSPQPADEADYAVPDVAKSSPPPSPTPPPQRPLAPSPPPQRPLAPSPPPQSKPAPAAAPSAAAAAGAKNGDPLGNTSLEEMRAKIGKNKRTQVKMAPASFSEKSNMFQAL